MVDGIMSKFVLIFNLFKMSKLASEKIFVLDTSVILHDNDVINSFEEHSVAIPITVFEELDTFKRGNSVKNFEARQFIRKIDLLSQNNSFKNWVSLGQNKGNFKIIFDRDEDCDKLLDKDIADHKILSTALLLQKEEVNCKVILVSKDINLRIKAKAMNLNAEDYETGKVKNIDELYTGRSIVENLTSDIIQKIKADDVLSDLSLIENNKLNNQFYIFKNGKQSVLAFYSGIKNQLERVKEKKAYGIKPMNAGQTFVQHAILNEDIKLVTVQGVSGTGKTLLALAYSLEQSKKFKQIIIARPIVPLGNNDIGFLPGDVDRKIAPYMEPLWDNLSFIKNQFDSSDKQYKHINKLIQNDKIVITPLAFIRGRSISDAIFIIDEAQNLTPHEAKTIITRAGENCKIIFTGDINQIDTPYLDEKSNGLSYIIDKLKGQKIFSHITLNNVERSELASIANELL